MSIDSKRANNVSIFTNDEATELVRNIFDTAVFRHGLLKFIIIDRVASSPPDSGNIYAKYVGVKISMVIAHRDQADGQSKR